MRKLLVVLGLLFVMASSAQAHIFGALVAQHMSVMIPSYAAVENGRVVIRSSETGELLGGEGVVEANGVIYRAELTTDLEKLPDRTKIYTTIAPTWDCLINAERVFNPASGYFESQCFEVESTGSIARFFETRYSLGDQNQFVLYVEDCDLRQTDLLVIKIDVVTTTTHKGDCGSCEFVMSM